MLTKALAKHFGAKLLIFDSHSLLGGLSSKEAELLKDGFNAEKSCSFAKQSPTATDTARSMDPPASEPDTPNSSNAPTSYGVESQPKLEADNVPSTSGTAKSCVFKLGDRVKYNCSSSSGFYQTSSRPASFTTGFRTPSKILDPLAPFGVRKTIGGSTESIAPFLQLSHISETTIKKVTQKKSLAAVGSLSYE